MHATDIDPAQLAKAPSDSKVTFATAPADQSGLGDNLVGAITVATALHWFDHAKFWAEVSRVACNGAILCAWTYHRADARDDTQTALLDPMNAVLEPYWSDANRLSWRGYSANELDMPFQELETPEFKCELNWRPSQIAAYVQSWSAYRKAAVDGHAGALAAIELEALSSLKDEPQKFTLPLHILAARVG